MTRWRNRFPLSPHFWLRDFESADTGQVLVYPQLVITLEALRVKLGRPIVVTSGYRTSTHNAVVGGRPDSAHMRGQAADLVTDDHEMEQLATLARAMPNLYVVRERDHVHVQLAHPILEP